jgi:hypothetical protein
VVNINLTHDLVLIGIGFVSGTLLTVAIQQIAEALFRLRNPQPMRRVTDRAFTVYERTMKLLDKRMQ